MLVLHGAALNFLEEFNLVSVDLSYHANVQFTYAGCNSSSWIDRILSSCHFALLVFKSLILLLISLIIIPSPVSL